MKNQFYLKNIVLLLTVLFIFSCTTEGTLEEIPINIEAKTTCKINGPKTVDCKKTSIKTYSVFLDEFNNNPTIKWTVLHGKMQIITNPNSNSIQVRFSNEFSGGALNVRVYDAIYPENISCSSKIIIDCDNGCQPLPTKPNFIRNKTVPLEINGYTICTFEDNEFYVDPVPNNLYEWRISPSQGVILNTSGHNRVSIGAAPGNYFLQVRSKNDCGVSPWIGENIIVKNCSPFFP